MRKREIEETETRFQSDWTHRDIGQAGAEAAEMEGGADMNEVNVMTLFAPLARSPVCLAPSCSPSSFPEERERAMERRDLQVMLSNRGEPVKSSNHLHRCSVCAASRTMTNGS